MSPGDLAVRLSTGGDGSLAGTGSAQVPPRDFQQLRRADEAFVGAVAPGWLGAPYSPAAAIHAPVSRSPFPSGLERIGGAALARRERCTHLRPVGRTFGGSLAGCPKCGHVDTGTLPCVSRPVPATTHPAAHN